MIYGSLFSGIGGIDLGFDRAGMTCAWQVENDDFCQKILAKHWPDVPKFKDIKDVGKHNLSAVDLVAGGFPCQPHSLAGQRKGKNDDRDLWPEYRRIIAELRPSWVVGENVPGIKGTILDEVLSDLESLDYQTATIDLPAVAFNAWHLRHRFFIIAHTNAERRDTTTAVKKSNHNQEWDNKASEQAGQSIMHEAESGIETAPHLDKSGRNGWAGEQRTERGKQSANGSWWAAEPAVDRMAHGIPNRVDRIKGLGNAVVPQVAEFLARQIIQVNYIYNGDD